MQLFIFFLFFHYMFRLHAALQRTGPNLPRQKHIALTTTLLRALQMKRPRYLFGRRLGRPQSQANWPACGLIYFGLRQVSGLF
jgi:hypothetical protein